MFKATSSPRANGPQFGQSRIGSSTSNYSGKSTGGGIASRFSLALSRVIDPTVESNATGNTTNQDDDDITEMR